MQTETRPRSLTSGITFVQPARPIEPINFSCSAVENLCSRVHHSAAQFFPIRHGADVEQIFLDMKRGLRLCMCEQPVITGTLRQDERGAFSVEIPPSPRAGAYLHFSDTSNDPSFPSFNELRARGFPYVDGNLDGLKELRPDPFPKSEDGHPIFVAKICHVRGGIIWTSSLSHLVTDLVQATTILARWAKYTKIVTDAAGNPVPAPAQPPWPDRKRLLPHAENGVMGPEEMQDAGRALQDYAILNPGDPEKMLTDIDNIFIKADVSEEDPDHVEQLLEPTSGIWRIVPSKLEILTKNVKESDPDLGLSQFDIVTAFIWQRLYMAKRGSKQDNEPKTAQILTIIDVRRRLNPPLPANYIGACIDVARVSMDREQLAPRKQKWKGIANIGRTVRQFGATWSEDAYMNMLKISMRTPVCPGLIPKGPIDMLVTDHTLVAAGLKADWGGELGSSVALRQPYIERDMPRGEVIILPRQPNGDLDLIISAEEIVLKRLMADAEMQAVCDCVFIRHNVLESIALARTNKAKL